ncbi:MAG: hypothetical protein Q9222_002374 [Ikaeria aurantiellina]
MLERRPAAAALYPRADTPNSIGNISNCLFPPGVKAAQPAYLSYKKLSGLTIQLGGRRGKNGEVWNAVSKWYLVRRRHEKSIIQRFLNDRVDAGAVSCQDLNNTFLPCGGRPPNRMQGLLDELPGMQFGTRPDDDKTKSGFAIVDQRLNGLKGQMFNRQLDPTPPDITGQLDFVRNSILLFRMMREPDMQRMFDIANNRVYSYFASLDQANGPLLSLHWAAQYRNWMNAYLARMPDPVWSEADRSTTRLPSPSQPACFGNQVEGNCQQAVQSTVPSAPGPRPPVCAKPSPPAGPLRISYAKARQAARGFCKFLFDKGPIILNEHRTAIGPWIVHDAAEHGGDLALSALYDTSACPKGGLNFIMDDAECVRSFFECISEVCRS